MKNNSSYAWTKRYGSVRHFDLGLEPYFGDNHPVDLIQMFVKSRPQLVLAGFLLAVILGIALWLQETPKRLALPSAHPVTEDRPQEVSASPSPIERSVDLPVGIIGQTENPLLPATIRLETSLLPWEEQIERILRDPASNAVKAKSLFGLLPKLPPAAWERTTQEALGRTSNRDYNIIALPLLINPQASGQVLGILFADVMDRPQFIHLPALLSVARMPGHPFAEPAHENLSAELGHDYGTDWSGWEGGIRQHLAQPQ